MAVKFYAVKKGKATGIFHTWEECKHRLRDIPEQFTRAFRLPPRQQNIWDGQRTVSLRKSANW